MKIINKNKKAQLKIQEMSFMLVAVVIFFVLAGLFFISIKYKEINKAADLAEKEKVISTLSRIADTAEFTCGKDSELCVDTDKLIVLKDRQEYKGFWPVTYLAVVKIYPKQEEEIECTKNNYPDCNLFKIYQETGKDVETESTFVSLCRKEVINSYIYEKCELGKIVAGFEPGSSK